MFLYLTDRLLEQRVWKKYSGAFALPTLIIGAICILAFCATWAATLFGAFPLMLGYFINVVVAYVVFTPLHESVHGNVKGKHRALAWLESSLGFAAAFILLMPAVLFKLMHLRHHARTNDPTHDPDFCMATNNVLALPYRALCVLPFYYYHYFSKPSKESLNQVPVLAVQFVVIVGAFISAGILWGFTYVLWLWLFPVITAILVLAIAFDWIPHRPHKEKNRYLNTRIVLFPGLNILLLGQNYHLIHHLYPRVPFYAYGRVFQGIRPLLKAHKCHILDFTPGKSTRGVVN